MSDLTLLSVGAQSLIVDLGRPGYRHLGVPHGGAADRLSFQLANWLVGNALRRAAIECAMGGLSIQFHCDTIIAITGATAPLTLNDTPLTPWAAHTVRKGDILSTGQVSQGARLYLAVQGGLSGTAHFDSLSTYTPARLGANEGRALAKGSELIIDRSGETTTANTLPTAFRPRLSRHITLRVRSVSEYEDLSAEAQRRLFVRPWTASAQTSRMGARLDGDPLELTDPRSLISSPLLPGTLQVPPGGQPILSLVDGHCTGGYVRAVQVIAADMWLAGQIGPGTRISFNRAFADRVPAITDAHMANWGALLDGYTL